MHLREGDRLQPNEDGTVTLITASGQEHTYDPDQVFTDDWDEQETMLGQFLTQEEQ